MSLRTLPLRRLTIAAGALDSTASRTGGLHVANINGQTTVLSIAAHVPLLLTPDREQSWSVDLVMPVGHSGTWTASSGLAGTRSAPG